VLLEGDVTSSLESPPNGVVSDVDDSSLDVVVVDVVVVDVVVVDVVVVDVINGDGVVVESIDESTLVGVVVVGVVGTGKHEVAFSSDVSFAGHIIHSKLMAFVPG
jgi:hypothetical protein